MTYYFVPGRLFDLSFAELNSVLKLYVKEFKISTEGNLILVHTDENIEILNLIFNRLGGYISYGKIIDINSDFFDFKEKNKIVFAINYYYKITKSFDFNNLKKLAEVIKKQFKEREISAKYLLSKSLKIDAFNLERNKILEKGFLLEIFEHNRSINYGIALGFQDAKKFSEIEYEKPFTDNKMGVVPFKLSKILINLSGLKEGQTVWDPFCGSGTILLAAYDMRINIIGSDIENKSVKMTEENINWLGTRIGDNQTKFNIFRMDILKPDGFVLSLLKKTEINACVCEPYMGPPMLSQVSYQKAKEHLSNVKDMYKSLFNILEHIKLKNFTSVIIIPSYKTSKGWVTLSVNEIISKKWEIVNKKIGKDLQWSRPDSIIRRNIFILHKGN